MDRRGQRAEIKGRRGDEFVKKAEAGQQHASRTSKGQDEMKSNRRCPSLPLSSRLSPPPPLPPPSPPLSFIHPPFLASTSCLRHFFPPPPLPLSLSLFPPFISLPPPSSSFSSATQHGFDPVSSTRPPSSILEREGKQHRERERGRGEKDARKPFFLHGGEETRAATTHILSHPLPQFLGES